MTNSEKKHDTNWNRDGGTTEETHRGGGIGEDDGPFTDDTQYTQHTQPGTGRVVQKSPASR